jgi:ubiquitin fusion degradation protein 1
MLTFLYPFYHIPVFFSTLAASRTATPDMPPGISVLDTDLEVDFAPPKGYVEPVRPPPKPVETMASRLGLFPESAGASATKGGKGGKNGDSGKSTPAISRPGSSMGTGGIGGGTGGGNSLGVAAAVVNGDLDGGFEAFKGRGETLNGRKTRGKGVRTGGRKIVEVDPGSKIERTE